MISGKTMKVILTSDTELSGSWNFEMVDNVPNEDTLGHAMSSPVVTVGAKATLRAEARKMVEHGIGAVIVVEGNGPVGIVTERDITKQSIKSGDVMKKPVKLAMSKSLVTAPQNMSVQEGVELMLKNKISRLPIIDGEELKGIVTDKDLMRWVLRVSYEPNIPKHIQAILESSH
jgi:CBS domain-containing protein